MIYNISADWTLDENAQNWLRDSYMPLMLEYALTNIAFAGINLVIDPRDSKSGLVLSVHLKSTTWIDEYGRADAGLYRSPTMDNPIHLIEIAWDQEFQKGYPVIMHELCHFLLLVNAIPGWDVFQHGMNVTPPSKDMYLAKVVEYARKAYPKTHSSNPFKENVDI